MAKKDKQKRKKREEVADGCKWCATLLIVRGHLTSKDCKWCGKPIVGCSACKEAHEETCS